MFRNPVFKMTGDNLVKKFSKEIVIPKKKKIEILEEKAS
jgi:hypothetical protein